MDSLARLMARGRVRVVTQNKSRLIDRAWQATVTALRNLTAFPVHTKQPVTEASA